MRIALLLLLSLTTVFAAETKRSLREFSPSKQLAGPRLTAALQKDKGTVLFYWLYEFEKPRNGQVLKSFQKIAEEYKDTLLVMGIENTQNSSMKPVAPKDLNALIKSAATTFPIFGGCRAPFEVHTYPSVYVFDREGRMLYGGVVSDELEELLKKAAAPTEKKDGKEEPKKDEKEKPKTDPKKAA